MPVNTLALLRELRAVRAVLHDALEEGRSGPVVVELGHEADRLVERIFEGGEARHMRVTATWRPSRVEAMTGRTMRGWPDTIWSRRGKVDGWIRPPLMYRIHDGDQSYGFYRPVTANSFAGIDRSVAESPLAGRRQSDMVDATLYAYRHLFGTRVPTQQPTLLSATSDEEVAAAFRRMGYTVAWEVGPRMPRLRRTLARLLESR